MDIISLKHDLEKEIISMFLLHPELSNLVQPGYFTSQAQKIIQFVKEKYNNNAFNEVDFIIECKKYNIEIKDNIWTYKEFENIYSKIKEYYYAINLHASLKRQVLHYLEKEYSYQQAIINLENIKNTSGQVESAIEEADNIRLKAEHVLQEIKSKETGLYSKLSTLDNMIKGFRPKQYCIIAGRPHMGKTTFALWLMYEFVKQNQKVLYFAFEQPAELLYLTLASFECQKPYYELTSEEISEFTEKYKDLIYFVNKPMTVFDIKFQAQTAKVKYNCNIVMIDYIGLIKSHAQIKRNELISEISKELKDLAMDNFIVFVLAQINRGIENKQTKKPTLAYLKESGALEEDADIILLLYREYYYKKSAPKDEMEIILAKNRGIGETGSFITKMINHNIREICTSENKPEIDYEMPF